MVKRPLFIIILLASALFSQAQFDTSFIKANILRNADSLTSAFKTKDWTKFTRYSYPAMVGSLGGAKEFGKYISDMFSQLPDSAWKKYEPGKVLQVVKTGGDYQAILELNTIIEWEGTRTTSTSHLIAESWDGGFFWTFFDSQGDLQAAKMIKPDLSELIVIPPRDEKREPYKQAKNSP
jgi:hypothetical protein